PLRQPPRAPRPARCTLLSLHDALPISRDAFAGTGVGPQLLRLAPEVVGDDGVGSVEDRLRAAVVLLQHDNRGVGERLLELEDVRSEEHTSELQSRVDIVCRLLLEKKKN